MKRTGNLQKTYDYKHLTVAFDSHARAGCFSPEVHFYRKGKQDSPNGFGPKGWPWSTGKGKRRWSDMVAIPLPHITFRTAYKYRKVPGLMKLSNLIQRLYTRAMKT